MELMSRESGSERTQRTVAELLAQHGGDSARTPRRRRRRAEEAGDTAPQAIIERIQSGDEHPHAAEPREPEPEPETTRSVDPPPRAAEPPRVVEPPKRREPPRAAPPPPPPAATAPAMEPVEPPPTRRERREPPKRTPRNSLAGRLGGDPPPVEEPSTQQLPRVPAEEPRRRKPDAEPPAGLRGRPGRGPTLPRRVPGTARRPLEPVADEPEPTTPQPPPRPPDRAPDALGGPGKREPFIGTAAPTSDMPNWFGGMGEEPADSEAPTQHGPPPTRPGVPPVQRKSAAAAAFVSRPNPTAGGFGSEPPPAPPEPAEETYADGYAEDYTRDDRYGEDYRDDQYSEDYQALPEEFAATDEESGYTAYEPELDDDYDEDADEQRETSSPGREWAGVAMQVGVGLVVGAAVWLGFSWLWGALPAAALVVALVVTVGLVWVVRKIRRADDLQTTVLAVLVGLVVTVSPAALLLLHH
ncbi:hypothetical protein EV193_101463 [Herbihabitans rhizosphaerae]|uniref:Uncharacterized protein n=2 Tax=Herbihabitans rhizosphaerae TaxID=1872711 RepID=A0A4Q7L5I1_9PSEU|nr:hypothetical protein EV193_101463 [Herbihabitans rhizosphaerae]